MTTQRAVESQDPQPEGSERVFAASAMTFGAISEAAIDKAVTDEPGTSQDGTGDPATNEPEINASDINEPEISASEISEPEISASDISEPEIGASDISMSGASEPAISVGATIEPVISEPAVRNEPFIHEPVASAYATSEPDISELDELVGDDTPSKAFREDPEIDRRIIEGMLQDRDQFITAMANEGYTEAVVLRRAAELGLSEALIRQVKGVAADLAGERPGRRPAPASLGARTCLSCDRIFLSSGPGNRLCMRCRGGDAGLAQL